MHENVSRELWASLPPEQIEAVMSTDAGCEIGPEFAGFVTIYRNLAEIIPTHYTVVDLGCAYAPQSWYFSGHRQYIGVDMLASARFSAPNTVHHNCTIRQFIEVELCNLDIDTTFGICSYVPPWRDDNAKLVRHKFRHCFVFYPCGGDRLQIGGKQ